MSRRRLSERPMWRFKNESDKSAVPIPYKLLYENGRRKYGYFPPMIILPEFLIGANGDIILDYIDGELDQYNRD